MSGLKMAYADPPYLGCGKLYATHHPEAMLWDNPETHRDLLVRLRNEFPDGWALSLSSPSTEEMLVLCREVFGPNQVRLSAWVKPFAVFRPNVNPAYAWEPIIWRGGRTKRSRKADLVRDWHGENITMKCGRPGRCFLWAVQWVRYGGL